MLDYVLQLIQLSLSQFSLKRITLHIVITW